MKVKELIELLQKCNPDAYVWRLHEAPYSCTEIELVHPFWDDKCYVICSPGELGTN